jgi:hypothetical protein
MSLEHADDGDPADDPREKLGRRFLARGRPHGVSVRSMPPRLRRFVMPMDEHCFQPAGGVHEAKGQAPLQTSAGFARSYNAQIHEIVDAIAAVVANAQAGLSWLRARPLDLEEVRQALNGIADDGNRAYEIVVRLRALMNEGAHGGLEPVTK